MSADAPVIERVSLYAANHALVIRSDPPVAICPAVHDWFTVGFDTADLKDAKTLLEELK